MCRKCFSSFERYELTGELKEKLGISARDAALFEGKPYVCFCAMPRGKLRKPTYGVHNAPHQNVQLPVFHIFEHKLVTI